MWLVMIWSGSPLLTASLHLGDHCIGFLDVSLYRYSDTSRYIAIQRYIFLLTCSQSFLSRYIRYSDTSRYSDTAIHRDTSYLMYRHPSGESRVDFDLSGSAKLHAHIHTKKKKCARSAPSGPGGARSAPQGRRAAARRAAVGGSAGRKN